MGRPRPFILDDRASGPLLRISASRSRWSPESDPTGGGAGMSGSNRAEILAIVDPDRPARRPVRGVHQPRIPLAARTGLAGRDARQRGVDRVGRRALHPGGAVDEGDPLDPAADRLVVARDLRAGRPRRLVRRPGGIGPGRGRAPRGAHGGGPLHRDRPSPRRPAGQAIPPPGREAARQRAGRRADHGVRAGGRGPQTDLGHPGPRRRPDAPATGRPRSRPRATSRKANNIYSYLLPLLQPATTGIPGWPRST